MPTLGHDVRHVAWPEPLTATPLVPPQVAIALPLIENTILPVGTPVSGLATETAALKLNDWPAADGLGVEASAVVVGAFTVTMIVFEVSESPETMMPTKPCAAPISVLLATPATTVGLPSPVTVPTSGTWEKVRTLELSRVSIFPYASSMVADAVHVAAVTIAV